jgi:hypothetical protein
MQKIELIASPSTPNLAGLIAQATKFLGAAKAKGTRNAYGSDNRDVKEFCASNTLPYLPSTTETVVLYISHLASRVPPMAVSTINRRLAALRHLHLQVGLHSPAATGENYLLHEVLAGIKRTLGTAQHGADPLLGNAIRRISRRDKNGQREPDSLWLPTGRARCGATPGRPWCEKFVFSPDGHPALLPRNNPNCNCGVSRPAYSPRLPQPCHFVGKGI